MTTSLWYAATLTLALSACHNSGGFSVSNEDETPAISIKERPHPRKSHQITMTIANAPGPFGMIEGSVQYDVTNLQECGEINSNTGMAYHINTSPPIQWQRLSDTEYVATIHSDLILDEDYYGRGMCHWTLTQARARLKATGAEIETRFVPTISAEEITAGQPVTWYFWKERYLVNTPLPSNGKGFADFGQKNLDTVPVDKRHEFFTITLMPTEAQP